MINFQYAALWTAVIGLFFGSGLSSRAADAGASQAPSFAEVYSVVRSNLTSATEAELNRAAVTGFLNQLGPRAALVTNTAIPAATAPLLSKTTAFEKAYGFLRVGTVGAGLAREIKNAFNQLAKTNRLEGVILDLRFADGTDYASAAEAADVFLDRDQPLLDWGAASARSTAKTAVITLPTVLLINQATSGAAEALAAALRNAGGALIIGSPSAGRAYVFRDVALSNGQTLRVASGSVTVGGNEKLPETGVAPDIAIAVKVEDEKAYFEDPYTVLAKPFAQSARADTNELTSLQNTNQPRRRMNEAELVRMQREGLNFEGERFAAGSPQPTGPVISDPAVSRALDLLKGLAMAAKRQ